MTIARACRVATTLLLVLGVAACAQRTGTAAPPPDADADPSPRAELPSDAAALVLRVEQTGGFTTPEGQAGLLPLISAYADGRVLLQGPVAAIYPGFAWPNLQVLDVGPDGVRALVERALAAGVADPDDLGTPPLADVPTTRFTVATVDATYVREAYGLTETIRMRDGGLTGEQLAARRELQQLVEELVGLASAERPEDVPGSWTPDAVAVIARPWTDREDGLTQQPLPWPGPTLSGDQLGWIPGNTCVVATGDQVPALMTAAARANVQTPWTTPDGNRWSVTFRPLLPDESSCADLLR
ncbi:hypothetical protein SAMN05660662_1982 [Blastococcus aurantiacus]|uniref:Uncharacterized protein n=1 Tax=Blastococcus aurantiacus TaxID=1550231 RepID=A0A1G7KPV3_9ACTN|nr:hypothetical protein [Blastococcus aurantiacus]SDF38779.1 hypothetical protein SAMN05660662_1982 [Blastococcus aurantiacus]